MKPITIDPKLQTIIEGLNNAKRLFNEVYNQMPAEGISLCDSSQKDFMSDIDSAIANTMYMVIQKVEFDIKRGIFNTVEEGGRK